jgi:hypothetical protein
VPDERRLYVAGSAYETRVLQELAPLNLSEDRLAILRDLVSEGVHRAEASSRPASSISDVMDPAVEKLVLEVVKLQAQAGAAEFRGPESHMGNQKWRKVVEAVAPWPIGSDPNRKSESADIDTDVASDEGRAPAVIVPVDPSRQIYFAQSVVVQLLTVSAAITTVTITFYGDIGHHANLATRSLLISSWCCFVVSIAFGCFTLLEMTGLLGEGQERENIYSKHVRVPAAIEVGFFMIAIVLVVVGGAVAVT